ncbi:ATP-binding protein [Arcicella rosea]|uniref:Putative AAA+ superfamily ATPase n=1 Tax=Arcicella rosea TaxID=502909 RepID=A0A841EMP4_9BACT|nr:ATP-binding protein [Arcicella rosea]MBB6002689.1 putative AAA+ superfamily ATPase [Arcicella rosea]
MITRSIQTEILESLSYLPAVAILGPRQVGKTTLVKSLMTKLNKPSVYLDLEYYVDQDKLKVAPDLYFQEHENEIVILDEIQRMPELFPLLRSMIDKNRQAGRFILLGSASPSLLRQSSETLAGRIIYIEMQGLHYQEIAPNISYQQHWLRGGFPDALLAPNDKMADFWFRGFVQTYIERDLPNLGLAASPELMRNMLRMLTNLQGGIVNYTNLSDSLNISQPTVKSYINFLESAFLIRTLKPYFTNISKRLVKSPKFFFRDTGILHHLMGIQNLEGLHGNIGIGNSWEGYVIQQIIANLKSDVEPFFYRTKDKAELDLVLVQNTHVKVTIEIKYGNSPNISKGNTLAIEDLGAKINLIVTPQADDYWYRSNLRVCNISTVWQYLRNEGLLN